LRWRYIIVRTYFRRVQYTPRDQPSSNFLNISLPSLSMKLVIITNYIYQTYRPLILRFRALDRLFEHKLISEFLNSVVVFECMVFLRSGKTTVHKSLINYMKMLYENTYTVVHTQELVINVSKNCGCVPS